MNRLDQLQPGTSFSVVRDDGVAQKCNDCGNSTFTRCGIVGDVRSVFFTCNHCGMKYNANDLPPGTALALREAPVSLKTAFGLESPDERVARLTKEIAELKAKIAKGEAEMQRLQLLIVSRLRDILRDIEEGQP
jgi:predicted RNA-binding Zn-ribbon protein involved in translation (DUF1610 family)